MAQRTKNRIYCFILLISNIKDIIDINRHESLFIFANDRLLILLNELTLNFCKGIIFNILDLHSVLKIPIKSIIISFYNNHFRITSMFKFTTKFLMRTSLWNTLNPVICLFMIHKCIAASDISIIVYNWD